MISETKIASPSSRTGRPIKFSDDLAVRFELADL
jgi:hypothetical protein